MDRHIDERAAGTRRCPGFVSRRSAYQASTAYKNGQGVAGTVTGRILSETAEQARICYSTSSADGVRGGRRQPLTGEQCISDGVDHEAFAEHVTENPEKSQFWLGRH